MNETGKNIKDLNIRVTNIEEDITILKDIVKKIEERLLRLEAIIGDKEVYEAEKELSQEQEIEKTYELSQEQEMEKTYELNQEKEIEEIYKELENDRFMNEVVKMMASRIMEKVYDYKMWGDGTLTTIKNILWKKIKEALREIP
jgi:vacuolar-type H+-ATPase subunit I/STV1